MKQVDQHIRKSLRSKDELVFYGAHNPKVVSSNLTATTGDGGNRLTPAFLLVRGILPAPSDLTYFLSEGITRSSASAASRSASADCVRVNVRGHLDLECPRNSADGLGFRLLASGTPSEQSLILISYESAAIRATQIS